MPSPKNSGAARVRVVRVVLVVLCALAVTAGPARAGLVEEAGSPIAVGAEPWWVQSADFNGDDRMDLAVANDESASPAGSVSILLRQPGGGFAPEPAITVGQRPDSLAAGDFDGDGRTDLAVANYVSSTVTVLLRRADNGGFDAEGAPIAVGTSPHGIAAGDVDGDGRDDLLTASHALSTVTVLLRNAANDGFAEEDGSPIAVGANPTQLAPADFDANGRLDVAVANRGSDSVTVLLRNAANDGFVAELGLPPAAGDAPVGIVAADFDADARPDLAVTGESSDDVTVLLRQAGGGFAVAPGSPHPAGDGAYGVTAGDFDGDAVVDLAATAFAANRVTVLHGTGNGAFREAPFSPLPTAKGPLVLAAADFDANGRDDLAIPNHGAHTVTVRLSQDDPAAPAPPTAPAGCALPSAGRVALWRGEDSARDSAGTNDGSLENGGAYRSGVLGRAFSLAGSDDYLHVPDRAALDVTGDLTFDAWVQIDDTDFGAPDPYGAGGDRVIVAKPDAADAAVTFAFWIEGDIPSTADSAPLAFAAGPRSDPATVVMSGALAWQQDTWYHLAVVRTGATVTFYRDGRPVGDAEIGGAPADTAGAPVGLGGSLYDATLFNPLKGALDEAGLWGRALGADEIAEIHKVGAGRCEAPPPPPPPPPPVEKPRNLVAPSIVDARYCVPQLVGPPRCTVVPNTYECLPGTWTGHDPDVPFRYEWRRAGSATTVDTGRYYRAAAETVGALTLRSWTFQCHVTAANDAGATTAVSAPRTLDPVYDPVFDVAPYGDFGIRGIDVFQNVQPNSGAQKYGFDPADIWPLNNGTGGMNPNYSNSTPFTAYPGGGTPTDWRTDGTAIDANPQVVGYDGVTLDTDKVATAVVYVNMLNGSSAYPDTPLQLKLSGTSDGAPIPNSPAAIYATIRNPPSTGTRFVTAAQRASSAHGVRMALPATWLRVASLDLRASVEFAPGRTAIGMRQCTSDPRCTDDDAFQLRDVDVAVGSERPAQLLIQPVPLADGTQSFPSVDSVLAVAKHLFPGGSRMRVMQYVGTQDITGAVAARPGAGSCPATATVRGCQQQAVGAVLDKWVTDNPPRPSWPAGGHVQRYDLPMGVHNYQTSDATAAGIVGNQLPAPYTEPGWAWNGTIEYIRRGPPAAPFGPGGPRFTTTATARPITAAAHELGHTLSLAHIEGCSGGELWPPDRRGRLQSTKFDWRSSGPPVVDADPSPQWFDLMSYCGGTGDTGAAINSGDHWISARGWNHAYGSLREMAKHVGSDDRPVIARAAAAGRAASVRAAASTATAKAFAVGSVSGDAGAIASVTPSDGDDAIPGPVPGSPLRLRALDAGGRVIADAGVKLTPSSEAAPGSGGTFVGPVPAAAAAVELVRGDRVLHRLTRTRAPRIRLLAPRRGSRARGSLEVRWSASDPDATKLDATIDYSFDGGRTWKNVHTGPSTGRKRLPGRLLVASSAGRVRVAVSDGFNEATAVSAPFRAAGRPPVIELERPLRGERLGGAGRSLLAATAFDDRDELLRGRAITWFAGGRRLGTGDRLYARLPAGTYLLRAVARDRLGRTASAGRRVRIAAQPLRLVELRAPATVKRGASRVTITVRASEAATFRIAGRRYRVGDRARRIVVALPKRPARGIVRLACTLDAPGRTTLRARVEVFRG